MNLKWILYCSGIMMMIAIGNSNANDPAGAAGDLFIKPTLFVIPVIQERKVKAIYSVDLVLELKNKKAADLAQQLMPRLIDAIYLDLYSVLGIVWEPGFRINLTGIKQRLLRVCNKILGPDSTQAVLIQNFNQQPMH